MKQFKTEQEEFWAGEFGDKYIDRNTVDRFLSSNIAMFSEIMKRTIAIESVIEFGANIGLNLLAIKQLFPNAKLSAIEINEKASNILKENVPDINEIFNQSILDFVSPKKNDERYDFVLIKGVLIHINPDKLEEVYSKLYETSKKYILIAEYYNPSPVTINYRGNANKLFKRDFAGELLDKYDNLELIDYGFIYHRDKNFPQDDITWFLLQKK